MQETEVMLAVVDEPGDDHADHGDGQTHGDAEEDADESDQEAQIRDVGRGCLYCKRSGIERLQCCHSEEGLERVYVHREGTEQIAAVEVDGDTRVAELRERGGAVGEDFQVWLEDSEIALEEELTLVEAGVGDRGHVLVGKRGKVTVGVFFNGITKTEEFPPPTRIAHVFRWATGKQGFDLSETDRAEHVLVLLGTQTKPEDDVHVGSLAGDDDRVDFELMSRERWQG